MEDELKLEYSGVEFYISLIFLCLLYAILFGEPGYAEQIMNEIHEHNFPSQNSESEE